MVELTPPTLAETYLIVTVVFAVCFVASAAWSAIFGRRDDVRPELWCALASPAWPVLVLLALGSLTRRAVGALR